MQSTAVAVTKLELHFRWTKEGIRLCRTRLQHPKVYRQTFSKTVDGTIEAGSDSGPIRRGPALPALCSVLCRYICAESASQFEGPDAATLCNLKWDRVKGHWVEDIFGLIALATGDRVPLLSRILRWSKSVPGVVTIDRSWLPRECIVVHCTTDGETFSLHQCCGEIREVNHEALRLLTQALAVRDADGNRIDGIRQAELFKRWRKWLNDQKGTAAPELVSVDRQEALDSAASSLLEVNDAPAKEAAISEPSVKQPRIVQRLGDVRPLPCGVETEFVDRSEALVGLDAALIDPKVLLVEVSGAVGIGKTSLVFNWVNQLRDYFDRHSLPLLIDWSLRHPDKRLQFAKKMQEALASIGQPLLEVSQDPDSVGRSLADALWDSGGVVFIDAADTFQRPHGRDLEVAYDDTLLREFVNQYLANGATRAGPHRLVVITTRWPNQRLLENVHVRKLRLGPLSDNHGADLLRTVNLRETDKSRKLKFTDDPDETLRLQELSARNGGNPLALKLLAKSILDREMGSLRDPIVRRSLLPSVSDNRITAGGNSARDLANPKQPGELNLAEHLLSSIATYEEHLTTDQTHLAESCRKLLWTLALFKSPLEISDLDCLNSPPILGLTDDVDREAALKHLELYGIITWQRSGGYAVNPLVQEYFSDQLRSKNTEAYRDAHARLYRDFLSRYSQMEPTRQKDSSGLRYLYEAAQHGCKAGLYQEVWDHVFIERLMLGTCYDATRKGAKLNALLTVLANFYENRRWSGQFVADLKPTDQAHALYCSAAFLAATRGFSYSDAADLYRKAITKAEAAGDDRTLLPARWGLFRFYLTLANYPDAIQEAIRIASLGKSMSTKPSSKLAALNALSACRLYQGKALKAWRFAKRGRNVLPENRDDSWLYPLDPQVMCKAYDAWSCWYAGKFADAFAAIDDCLSCAAHLGYPHSLATAHYYAARLYQLAGLYGRLEEHGHECLRLTQRHGLRHWQTGTWFLLGFAKAMTGDMETGLHEMQVAFDRSQRREVRLGRTAYCAIFAEAILTKLRRSGANEQLRQSALQLVLDGTNLAEKGRERYYLAELYRLRGELEIYGEDFVGIEIARTSFENALKIARDQKCVFHHLKAAASNLQFQIWVANEKRSHRQTDQSELPVQVAEQTLGAIVNSLRGEPDIGDLAAARALLARRNPPQPRRVAARKSSRNSQKA